jgi:hypothetical protein
MAAHGMAQLFPHPRHSLDRWLRRIDRAAAALNPVLTMLAIGLAVLNLICLALLAPRPPINNHVPGFAACPPAAAGSPETKSPASGDQRVWPSY